MPTEHAMQCHIRKIGIFQFFRSLQLCGFNLKTYGTVGVLTHGHFVSVDVLVQGLFGMGTFWHKDFLAPWTLQHGDISAHGHFVILLLKC